MDEIDTMVVARHERMDRTRQGVPTFFDKVVVNAVRQHESFASAVVNLENAPRFMNFTDRRSYLESLGPDLIVPDMIRYMSQGLLDSLTWSGLPLVKSVFDIALYTELLQELQPRTIIELGSGSGASALWMKGQCLALNIDTSIVSLDVRPVSPGVKCNGVFFITGDARLIEQALPVNYLTSLPHPWLIIEDCHVNVHGALSYLLAQAVDGDYLFVEDVSNAKMHDVARLFEDIPALQLDRRYLDFFGINATTAKDAIARLTLG